MPHCRLPYSLDLSSNTSAVRDSLSRGTIYPLDFFKLLFTIILLWLVTITSLNREGQNVFIDIRILIRKYSIRKYCHLIRAQQNIKMLSYSNKIVCVVYVYLDFSDGNDGTEIGTFKVVLVMKRSTHWSERQQWFWLIQSYPEPQLLLLLDATCCNSTGTPSPQSPSIHLQMLYDTCGKDHFWDHPSVVGRVFCSAPPLVSSTPNH